MIEWTFGNIRNVDLVFPDRGRRRSRDPLRPVARRSSRASPDRCATICSFTATFPSAISVEDPINVAAFLLFTFVAVVVSHIAAAEASPVTVAARERVRMLELLYAFSRKLAGVATLDDVLWATTYQIALMLESAGRDPSPGTGHARAVRAGYPPEDTIGEADVAAARWAWENDRSVGRGSDTLPGAKRLFLPMRTGRGVTRHHRHRQDDKSGPLLTPDQRRLLSTRCPIRAGRDRNRDACVLSRTWTGRGARSKPTGCVRRCWPSMLP